MIKQTTSARKLLAVVAAGLVLLAIMLLEVFVYDDIDRCLDRGGAWNDAAEACEGANID